MLLSPTSHKTPILIIGLPRSGTTWVASVLSSARNVRYFHEPFNKDHVPEAAEHWLQYLRADDYAPDFARFCQQVFSGKIDCPAVNRKLSPSDQKLSFLNFQPKRILIKDVHSCMALDWIDRNVSPKIIIVTRHPCALASSWATLFKPALETGNIKGLQRLLAQPKLIEDYLHPFQVVLQSGQGFWQNLALYWGATYFVLSKQLEKHPDWLFVRHEDLCKDPIGEYQKIFHAFDLQWTSKTESLLREETQKKSDQPYAPTRISSQEPDKWKKKLEPSQVRIIQSTVEQFNIPHYSSTVSSAKF